MALPTMPSGKVDRKRLQAAELRVHVGKAALVAADGVGAAGFAFLGGRAVIFPFAKTPPDGVDRRQVGDVEMHRLDVVEVRRRVGAPAIEVGHQHVAHAAAGGMAAQVFEVGVAAMGQALGALG